MKTAFIVGLGGFCGTLLRYAINSFFARQMLKSFPYHTLTVNLLGSFLIGIVFGLTARGNLINESWRLFLMVGLCGGFTTFSSFSLEGIAMLEKGNYLSYLLYTVLSVIGGAILAWLGVVVTK